MKAGRAGLLLLLTAGYAACFLALTYPVGLHMGSCFASDAGGRCAEVWQRDSCIFVWNIYNFTESIHAGQNPFRTDRIFHPYGTGLWLHVYAPVFGAVGLLVGSPVLALNLTVAAAFILSGLGAFLLADHYLRRASLSALAGLAFAFCPYKLLHLRNHYDLVLTATIPFFVLCFVKAFRGAGRAWPRLESRRHLAAALVCLAVTFLSCYYYLFFLLVFAALYAAYYRLGLSGWDPFSRRALGRWVIVLAASTAAMNLLKLASSLGGSGGRGAAENGLGGSTDLLALLVPSASSRFLAFDLVRHVRLEVLRTNAVESTVYVGYAVLAFAVAYVASRQYRRETADGRLPAFMCGCFLVLAMPVLRLADRSLCATPSAVLHFIPFVDNFRAPHRYAVMVMLFLPILGCLFINSRVLPRVPRRLQGLVVVGLGTALLAEYAEQDYALLCRSQVPRVYERLASLEGGTLLELPFGLRDGFHWRGDERTDQLYYQTVHGKPLIAGLVSRSGGELFDRILADPVAAALISMQEDRSAVAPRPGAEEVEAFLRTFGVRYVIIHPDYRGSAAAAYLEGALGDRVAERRDIDGHQLMVLAPGSAAATVDSGSRPSVPIR